MNSPLFASLAKPETWMTVPTVSAASPSPLSAISAEAPVTEKVTPVISVRVCVAAMPAMRISRSHSGYSPGTPGPFR